MKTPTKIVVVIAIVAAIWYGSNAKDRARWLAALGVSRATATELRIENTRDKFHADRAIEQARWRTDARAQPVEAVQTGVVLSVESVCAGVADKEAMLHAQGKELEASARRIKAACGGGSSRPAY
jgi:hypothetical protein